LKHALNTVLVIDDRPEFSALLAALLAGAGCCPVLASNGKDGLKLLHTQEFDLVVTDISMPEEDGFGVLRGLWRAGSRIPAIVVTGDAKRWPFDLARFAGMLGAAACLEKPFPPEAFLATVKRLLPVSAVSAAHAARRPASIMPMRTASLRFLAPSFR